MYLRKMPSWAQKLMPHRLWHMATAEKVLYLTFDDGPIPEVTPWVLQQLASYGAKATFFCVGDNVRKHPDVYQAVLDQGHRVGNHTFNHVNGWKTPDEAYLGNVEACAACVESRLFRPPYGRLTRTQRRALQPHYTIVMWSILTGDFDVSLAPEACWQHLKGRLKSGDIIVFHDSLKAHDRLAYTLPRLLSHYAAQGYRFESLPPQ